MTSVQVPSSSFRGHAPASRRLTWQRLRDFGGFGRGHQMVLIKINPAAYRVLRQACWETELEERLARFGRAFAFGVPVLSLAIRKRNRTLSWANLAGNRTVTSE